MRPSSSLRLCVFDLVEYSWYSMVFILGGGRGLGSSGCRGGEKGDAGGNGLGGGGGGGKGHGGAGGKGMSFTGNCFSCGQPGHSSRGLQISDAHTYIHIFNAKKSFNTSYHSNICWKFHSFRLFFVRTKHLVLTIFFYKVHLPFYNPRFLSRNFWDRFQNRNSNRKLGSHDPTLLCHFHFLW